MAIDLDVQIDAVLEQYFADGSWKVVAEESGVNNTTRFVEHNNGKYVLRIYDNHTDPDKVRFEYTVLQQLQLVELPFQTPKPVRALNGDYYARTPSGKLVILFAYMEGKRADMENNMHAASIGRAVGALVTKLGELQVDLNSAYEPYYELYEIHPLVTQEKLKEWLLSMQQGNLAKEAKLLDQEIQWLQNNLTSLQKLPVQLVHSDIVAGNVLVRDDKVSAILDFEFVTPDLRVMDAAVFINEIIRYHSGRLDLLEAFIKGYAERARLTEDERNALPRLVLLRSVVLCLHFWGRQWAGIDPVNTAEPYLSSFASVHEWMSTNQGWLLKLCNQHGEGR